jgi:LmbE family N-acetylglucosaminyl deacetylase
MAVSPDIPLFQRWRFALARRFLIRIKRASHRMPVQRVPVRKGRILIIAPHMDDEVIGCGGALLLHRNLGSEVRVVFVSDSASGVADPAIAQKLRELRQGEMERVRAVLGFQSVDVQGFPDGSLVKHEDAIARRLADDIRAFQPDQIFCPFPVDGHADHQACALALGEAARSAGWQGQVMAYEVWSTLWPNVAIDISTVAEEKEALIRLYASQMEDRDYAAGILALNRYRGLQHRLSHAEAYHLCSAAEFRQLTHCLNEVL